MMPVPERARKRALSGEQMMAGSATRRLISSNGDSTQCICMIMMIIIGTVMMMVVEITLVMIRQCQ
jgi:hypothetical protein